MATTVTSPSTTSRQLPSQGSSSERSDEENGSDINEGAQSSSRVVQECTSVERDKDINILRACELPVNAEPESAHASGLQACTGKDAEIVGTPECSSSGNSLGWKFEDSDAPKVPEGFTMVAESKFLITAERFFDLFFSDNAIGFMKSFRKKCGDLEFHCTPWRLHEQMGHSRDVSFQHPIKIFIGARFSSCKEVQKYCMYRNSHLLIETSQEVNDVPYGDYFTVETLWDVDRNNEMNNGCILKVYTNVAFSKKTMFKGKIVQSAVEESRQTHEFLKQKHLRQRALSRSTRFVVNNPADPERQETTDRCSKAALEANDLRISGESLSPKVRDQQVPKKLQDGSSGSKAKFFTSLRGQSQVFGLLVVITAMILILMQMSILISLSRPQQINVIRQVDYPPAYLDKQINNLKDKISMVETSLDKIQREHVILKKELKELELYRKKQR